LGERTPRGPIQTGWWRYIIPTRPAGPTGHALSRLFSAPKDERESHGQQWGCSSSRIDGRGGGKISGHGKWLAKSEARRLHASAWGRHFAAHERMLGPTLYAKLAVNARPGPSRSSRPSWWACQILCLAGQSRCDGQVGRPSLIEDLQQNPAKYSFTARWGFGARRSICRVRCSRMLAKGDIARGPYRGSGPGGTQDLAGPGQIHMMFGTTCRHHWTSFRRAASWADASAFTSGQKRGPPPPTPVRARDSGRFAKRCRGRWTSSSWTTPHPGPAKACRRRGHQAGHGPRAVRRKGAG